MAASFEYVDEQGEGTFRFWPPSLYTLLLMVPIPELAISYGLTSVSNLRLQLYPGFAGAPMPVAKVVYSHLLLRQRRATPELSLFFELGTGIGPLSYGFSEPEVAVLLPNGVGAAASYLLGDSTIVFSGLRLESPVFFAVNRSGWAMPGAYNVGGNIMLYSAESAFHGFALLGFEQKLFGPLSLSIEVRGGLLGYQHRGPRYFGDPVVTYRMLFGYVALYPGLSLTF